jgi:hypothetical protein
MHCCEIKRGGVDDVQIEGGPGTGEIKYWLWRAVDSKGVVLDILVQSWSNKRAATPFQ